MIGSIVPIVEGHSEEQSIPTLLRRVLHDRGIFDIRVDRVIREHRQRLARPEVFLNRLRMAQHRPDCRAIVVVFDADDDAACLLAPKLRHEARRAAIATPLSVVLAVREIEAWMVAGVNSLRGCRGVFVDAASPPNPESIRAAKEWLNAHMDHGYKPTIDQAPLLQRLDYQEARHRAPSLDKLLRDLDELVGAMRVS